MSDSDRKQAPSDLIAVQRGLPSPCPLCRHVLNCPFDERYRKECLEFWPLGKVGKRSLEAHTDRLAKLRRTALWIPWVEDMVRTWESGGRITDRQYLRLRAAAFERGPEHVEPVYMYVLQQFLRVGFRRHIRDGITYFRLRPEDEPKFTEAAETAVLGALIIARDDVVASDTSSPVVSHFERLVYDCFRIIFHALLGVGQLQLPEEDAAFVREFEKEWARALTFGNGYFGLTVTPLISILDMVRYQQLGGPHRAISRSIVEYVLVLMDVQPHTIQLVAPLFRDVALKARLISMFDPLVANCALEGARRLEWAGEEPAATARPRLREEFTAVLSGAIEEYRFMHGKSGGVEDAVGMLGLSSSTETRAVISNVLDVLGIPDKLADLVHLNAANYLQARVRGHLREHYPVSRDAARLDEPVGDDGDALSDFIADDVQEQQRRSLLQDVVAPFSKDGVEYFYIDQMAYLSHVKREQLRWWDREGLLPAQRLSDFFKVKPSRESEDWRVYPYTDEMLEKIRGIAKMKGERRSKLAPDEMGRTHAARELGISYKTLERWETVGKARPLDRKGRMVYTKDEIARLLAAKAEKSSMSQ